MKKPPTRHCDQCRYFFGGELFPIEDDPAGLIRWRRMPYCNQGFKPRFYMPTGPADDSYGWKRKCEAFAEIER